MPVVQARRGRLHRFDQLLQNFLDVRDNRQVNDLILIDFRWINVDVNNKSVLSKFRHFSSHSVIESDSDRQEQIGLIDGVIGVDASMHAKHV